ncbi:MAG TPA: hypothetical protein VMV76_02625, partial [Dehalococcoidia bacterium]|nr:hypothetical protein [Dehalococcoidia bacterium]
MVTARDMPPIKASRLVGFLINVAYYTGKLHGSSCGSLDPQGEARASLLSLINQATTKAWGAGQAPPLPLLRLRGGRGVV